MRAVSVAATRDCIDRAAPIRGASLGAPVALLIAPSLIFALGDASAAPFRDSAAAHGALVVFASLLFLREWPIALTSSIWAGAMFAAAFWYFRLRPGAGWLSLANRGLVPPASGPAPALTLTRPAAPACGSAAAPEGLLCIARNCFVDLQAAWDAGDLVRLRAHTTSEMLDELLQELPARGPGPNRTDVLALDAALLGFERLGSRYLASVEFSGMIRESAEQGAVPFKEVWMLTCEENEMPHWRLARQQALL